MQRANRRLLVVVAASAAVWWGCRTAEERTPTAALTLTAPDPTNVPRNQALKFTSTASTADGAAGSGEVRFRFDHFTVTGPSGERLKDITVPLVGGEASVEAICDDLCPAATDALATWENERKSLRLRLMAALSDGGLADAGEGGGAGIDRNCDRPNSVFLEGNGAIFNASVSGDGGITVPSFTSDRGLTVDISLPTGNHASQHRLEFFPAPDQVVAVGTYSGVSVVADNPSPLLRIGNIAGCTTLDWSADVTSITYSYDHKLRHLRMSFEQRCDGSAANLVRGCVNFDAVPLSLRNDWEKLPQGSCVFDRRDVIVAATVDDNVGVAAAQAMVGPNAGRIPCMASSTVVRALADGGLLGLGSDFVRVLVADSLERPPGSAAGTPWQLPLYNLANDGYVANAGCSAVQDFTTSPHDALGFVCTDGTAVAFGRKWPRTTTRGFTHFGALRDDGTALLVEVDSLSSDKFFLGSGDGGSSLLTGVAGKEFVDAYSRPDGFGLVTRVAGSKPELWDIDPNGGASFVGTYEGVDLDHTIFTSMAATDAGLYAIQYEYPQDGGLLREANSVWLFGAASDAGTEVFRRNQTPADYVTPSIFPQMNQPNARVSAH